MKKQILIFFVLFSIVRLTAQDKILISVNEDIKIFETNLSLNSEGNIWPTIYKEGLIYSSNYRNNKYFYSDFKSKSIRFKTGSSYTSGPVAIFNNEIYFTGLSKSKSNIEIKNNTIYKGLIKDFKIVDIESLPILNPNFSFADPSISKDGKRMVVVSNEKGYPHLLELIRNDKDEWVKGKIIYISNPEFDILNPTIFNENTIYFSSNTSSGKIEEVLYTVENSDITIVKLNIEKSDFNIFKVEKKGGNWLLPVKVAMFNSESDDLSVVFKTPKSGYINSFRYNNSDNIYYFELK